MWAAEEEPDLRFIVHDRNTKFTESFDQAFKASEIEIVKTPFQAPIANCYAESWIGSMKRECLNHFACFGLRHLDHIVQTYAAYHNTVRPHQGLDNRTIPAAACADEPPGEPPPEALGPIRRQPLLGGLLNHYHRKAA